MDRSHRNAPQLTTDETLEVVYPTVHTLERNRAVAPSWQRSS